MEQEVSLIQEGASDEISVKEVEELCTKVENFYKERGKPSINLFWLARAILKRLYNDMDYYVNCEGVKGTGKSNLILLLSIIICRYSGLWKNKNTGKIVKVYPRSKPLTKEWEHIKFGFQFSKNMSFLDNTEELKRKFYSIDKYMPFIVDEGSKNLHKYQWATKLQFMLVQVSDTERWQNKSFFVCFPNFKELNPTFRNDRINMRLYVFNKNITQHFSQVIISLRDVNRHVIDKWHTDENAKQFEYLLRKVPTAQRAAYHILYAESKLKGFAGVFDVPALSFFAPRIWEIYMYYKMKNAVKNRDEEGMISEVESTTTKKWKYSTYRLVEFIKEKFPDINNKAIGEILDTSAMMVSKLINDPLHKEKRDEVLSKIRKVEFSLDKM